MSTQNAQALDRLLEIMASLRDPETGCPWDVEQSFETIAPYTLEEAYEVDHAIRTGDMESLCDELGDLLLQVVFHAQMADEAGHFDFGDVARAICDKLVRRHPHVFVSDEGDGTLANFESAEEQTKFWEEAKAKERAERSANGVTDPFDGIPVALPALSRATKLQKRASRLDLPPIPPRASADLDMAAFDRSLEQLVSAARPETEETPSPRASELVGQLLERCVKAARELGVDPEDALRAESFAFEESVKQALARGAES